MTQRSHAQWGFDHTIPTWQQFAYMSEILWVQATPWGWNCFCQRLEPQPAPGLHSFRECQDGIIEVDPGIENQKLHMHLVQFEPALFNERSTFIGTKNHKIVSSTKTNHLVYWTQNVKGLTMSQATGMSVILLLKFHLQQAFSSGGGETATLLPLRKVVRKKMSGKSVILNSSGAVSFYWLDNSGYLEAEISSTRSFSFIHRIHPLISSINKLDQSSLQNS